MWAEALSQMSWEVTCKSTSLLAVSSSKNINDVSKGHACTRECGLDSESVRQEEVWSRADLSKPKVCFSPKHLEKGTMKNPIKERESLSRKDRLLFLRKQTVPCSCAATWTFSKPIASARKRVLLPPGLR